MTYHRTVLAALLTALVSLPLAAQSATGRLLIGAGTATDLRGVRSGAYAVAPSLSLAPGPNLALSLGARGTRFTNSAWSLGGTAAVATRAPLAAGFALLLSGNGDAIRTSYRATYLSAEGLPALEWRGRWLSLWGGVDAATARTAFEPAGAPGTPLTRNNAVTRSLWGPAFGAGLRFARFDRSGSLSVAYREQHAHPGGVSVIDRTASLGLADGVFALSGSLGFRSASDERRAFGGARLGFRLSQGIELVGAAESYPSNRLTGAAGGRAFTAGMSLGIGGPPRARALPKPAGVPAARPELTRLSFSAPGAGRVEVAGDWNGWHAVALQRSPNGVWYVDLVIPPGVYRYAFRIDGKTWEIPKGVAAVNDGFGGKSAWLSVSEPGRTATQSANRKEAP